MIRSVPRRQSAFTLVELLVVISIIAILAAILLPVLGKIQENANSTKCSSNLRQIGVGINGYTTDNDGLLPGPLSLSQYAIIGAPGAKDDMSLYKLLASYLSLVTTANATLVQQERGNLLICPSLQKLKPKLDVPVYVLNPRKIKDLDKPPFGDANGHGPVRKATLSTWVDTPVGASERPVDLTQTWAIKDADQMAFIGSTETPPDDIAVMVPKPVHGDHRNALFYDWHVGKLNSDPIKNDEVK